MFKINLEKKYIVLLGFAAIVIIIYIIGGVYFTTHFLPNTFAGPVDISQMSVGKAEEVIKTELSDATILFQEDDQDIGYIELNQVNASFESSSTLVTSLPGQNPWTWPLAAMFGQRQIDIASDIELDDQLVEQLIPNLGVNNHDRTATQSAKFVKEEDGSVTIAEEIYGNQVTKQSLEQTLKEAIGKGEETLALKEAYETPALTTESETIQILMAQLDKMRQSQITLEFDGNSVTIPSETIESFIYVSDEGDLQLDEELIQQYILELNQNYAGLFRNRMFNSTYQGVVEVQAGTYGWYIDRFEEARRIAEDIRAGATVTREPTIGGSGYGLKDNVGGDYVEVDIDNQMMLIYLDNELVLETPIVSGIIGAETVPGAYQIWDKEEDATLVGYNVITNRDYQQPVKYWVPFDDQAQGIHDASWQPTFGGNSWMNSGSQGCINTPPGIMGQVFELVYIGMPVIIF